MNLQEILKSLENTNNQVLVIRQIITASLNTIEEWKEVANILEKLIKKNEIIGKENILLASKALFLLYANFDKDNLNDHVISFLNYKDDDTLKLTIAYGYLQLKERSNLPSTLIYKHDIIRLLFYVIQPHCINYTKYSYFAHKVLYQWLVTTSNTNYWTINCSDVENDLEAIIFSNWQNSIQDVAKHNSTKVFNLYLRIMNDKYEGFLEFILKNCLKYISWNHIIKFKILTEVCSMLPNKYNFSREMQNYVIEKLLNALLISHLQKASSNILEIMLKKQILNLNVVMRFIYNYVHSWREDENDEVTFFLYKYILQTIFQMCNTLDKRCIIEHGILLENRLYNIYIRSLYNCTLSNYIFHFENRTLNYGYLTSDNQKAAYISLFPKYTVLDQFIIQHVLSAVYTWANTESVYLRNEMIRNVDIIFKRFVKFNVKLYTYMLSNLYVLLDYCLGIASTYQRKILGLAIFKNMLQSTNGELAYCYIYNNEYKNLKDDLRDVECYKICKNEYIMRNRLFRLVLDPANNIRAMATNLLVSHFLSKPLNVEEVQILKEKINKHSNSLNFYEAETAAILIKLLYKWKSIDYNLLFWIRKARCQLSYIRHDIYIAISKNQPFYGILIIILENFNDETITKDAIEEDCLKELLNLLEDAVEFFTETLMNPIQHSEYVSSVAGIGIAVNEAIKNHNLDCDDLIIKPEHQQIFTCMWRSLKACSELAAKIAIKSILNDTINRSCNVMLNILFKCYHKGAIKAAGSSLSRTCGYFCQTNKINHTTTPFENQIKNLCKLTKGNDEEAGFIIAFHAIVVSDVRPERPFLHYTVKELLKFLKNRLKIMNLGTEKEHARSCVLQLNFLQKLIEDKQLLSSITIYLEEACLISLEYMQAKDFLVRNAGMQLYGSIIPRLTGQIASTDNHFGYGYSVCHFVIHYPFLSKNILQSLEAISRITQTRMVSLESYSNLSNILILLSKLFVGGTELVDNHVNDYINRIRLCLQSFLKCHIAYVRLLTAKVYVAFTGISQIVKELIYLAHLISVLKNENELHGYLLAFTYLKEKANIEIKPLSQKFEQTQVLRFWTRRCHQLGKSERPSFIVETLLLRNPEILYILGYLQFIDKKSLMTDELRSLILPEKCCLLPGFHEFVDELINQYCKSNNYWSNTEFIKLLLMTPSYNYGVSFFKFATVTNDNLEEVVNKINDVLYSINIHKPGQEFITNTNDKKMSLFEVLQPEVVESIATFKLFDRAWKYNCQETSKINMGIEFCKNDIDRLTKECVTIRLFYKMLHNFSTLGYESYYTLPDVYRKIYADFINVGKKLTCNKNVEFYRYIFMISRDEVPEIRDIFQNELEDNIYTEIQNEVQLSGFCSKIQYDIIKEMRTKSTKDYVLECQQFLQLIKSEIYNGSCNIENSITNYRDDIFLLIFVNHLLNIRTNLLSNAADDVYILKCATRCHVLNKSNYFSSLEKSICTFDEMYILEVNDYVKNKLSEVNKK